MPARKLHVMIWPEASAGAVPGGPAAGYRLVRSLDWHGQPTPATLPTADLAYLRDRLGDGAFRWVLGVTQRSVATLRAENLLPPFANWAELDRFAVSLLGGTLLALAGQPAAVDAAQLIDGPMVADIVAHDAAVTEIYTALRAMQREWLSLLMRAAAARPDGTDAIPAVVLTVTSTIDTCIDTVRESILEERSRVSRSEQVRARAAIEAMVLGHPVDERAVSRLLGVAMDGWHVGCVLGVRPGRQVELSAVDDVARAFASAAGVARPVRYETSTGPIHLWATLRSGHPPDLRRLSPVPGMVIGVGEPRRGVEGFRRTHLEALDAMDIALLAAGSDQVAYRNVALAALLSRDDERARWFVDHELGELAGDSREMADLRVSLHAFFDARMRIAPAAESLFIHRNTLISRLERVEVHLGRKITERTAETQAALLLHEILYGEGYLRR